MTIITATANTAFTNLFDSDVLQAITSGNLGSHSSSQFEFSNDYFILDATGTGFGYSGGHPSGGTMTSMELQLSTGVSDWSGFSVSVASLWNAVSSGDTTGFGNLFFSGNDTFNMQLSNGQDNLAGGAGNDTFNYAGNLSEFTHIDGGSGANTLNLAGNYYGDPYQFENVTNIQVIHLAAGGYYGLTISPTAALVVDGSALGAGNSINFQTSGNTSFSVTVTGGAGNDIFEGGSGNDTFNGGAGSDTIDCSHATSGLTIDLNQTTIQGAGAGIGTDTISSVENAIGTQFNDTFIGNAADNTFFSNGGIDTFNGGAGNDTVSLTGTMTIDLRSGASHIAGTDTFVSIEKVIGSGTFYGNSDDNIFDAGNNSGSDIIDYSDATGGMTFNMTSLTEVPSSFITTIVATGGGQGTDTLSGFEHVIGTQYDDTFYCLFDPLDPVDSPVFFDGGAGTDTVSFQKAASGVFVDLSKIGTSIEHMVGSAFDDWLAVDSGAVTIDGGAGNDTIQGADGNDTLNGGDGNDVIQGETGNDIINGGAGDDILCGGGTYVSYGQTGGDDTLNGGAGNDTLYADDQYDVSDGGNCIFDGGPGDDVLNGSGGIDTATYQDATSGVTVSLNTAKPQAVGGGLGTDTLFSIENLIGSNFNDTLIGGGAHNVLSGMGGNDTIDISQYNGGNVGGYPGPGNDTVYGGDGDDTIIAGGVFAANDTIDGGAGNDTLLLNGNYSAGIVFGPTTMVNVEQIKLGAGFFYKLTLNDANVAAGQTLTIDGHVLTGTNTLTVDGSQETDGNLILLGGAGNDVLTGGGGDDTFVGGAGNDTLNGGGGNDTAIYANAVGAVTVDLSLSTAQIIGGGQGNDTLTSIENVIGSNFDDTLSGNSADNILNGGGGTNTVSYAHATGGVTVNLSSAPQNVGGGEGTDTLISIENLTGSAFDDTLIGNGGNNTLDGGDGNDTLYLNTGGDDIGLGGNGNDKFLLGAAFTAADRLDGGAGIDSLSLNGDYTGANAVVFNATTMINIESIGLAAGHSYTLTTNDATVAAGQTLTVGGQALTATDALTFDGSQETNGKFILYGGAGNDVLKGGAGGDIFFGNGGNDTLNGGGGIDTASYANAAGGVTVSLAVSGAQAIGGGQGSDTLISIENLTSSNFNDALVGSSGDNVLSGGLGDDTLDLSAGGNDTAQGGDGNDTIVLGAALTAFDHIDGGAGADTVTLDGDYSGGVTFAAQTMINVETISLKAGHSYNLTTNDATVAAGQTLTVSGAALGAGDTLVFNGAHETNGNFIIRGGAGNDVITGGAGADTITGGLGADHLAGGGGADIFVYATTAQSTGVNYDTINGFNFANADKFDLAFTVAAVDAKLKGGALSLASFDSDLATAVNSAHLGVHDAVLFTPNTGDLAGKTFLVIDANGVAGYQAGKDIVIELDHTAHPASIDVTDFI